MRSIGSTARALGMAALGVLAAVVVTESILRITDVNAYDKLTNDSASGLLIYRPNGQFEEASSCFTNRVQINEAGFHAPAFPNSKGEYVFRILVVGSSFVESLQASDAALFSSRLQEKLNANPKRLFTYEVIPIGFSGNGTFLNVLYFLRFGASLNPDLVIDLSTEYEVSRNAPDVLYPPRFDEAGNLVLHLPETSAQQAGAKNIVRQSKFAMNMYNRFVMLRQEVGDFLKHPTFTQEAQKNDAPAVSRDLEPLWEVEEKVLSAFGSQVQHANARFMLASWASPFSNTSTAQALHDHFTNVAERQHVAYADLVPAVQRFEEVEGKSATWACDGHWNEDGHRFVADALFDFFQTHSDLLQR